MAEEQIIKLLEIRDLQKQHAENYKYALANQEQAIATQRAGAKRLRIFMAAILTLMVVAVGYEVLAR